MNTDLTYSNKSGISLQNILDILVDGSKTKKDIQTSLNTSANIDALIKKLEESSLVKKEKVGQKFIFSIQNIPRKVESVTKIVEETVATIDTVEEIPQIETQKPKKINRAKPVSTKTPAEIKNINQLTENISKDHQITNLVEMDKKEKIKKKNHTTEVDEENLELLRKELSSRLGKDVTALLHKRKDRAIKDRKQSAQEIYEQQQKVLEQDAVEYEMENPYRFILNFFTSTLNGEKATPYFRRRDEYVVKSIYNKFNSLCEKIDDYSISSQNLPFYRAITINETDLLVKIYHIDMNRIVRGVYTLFKLNPNDIGYFKF